MAAVATMMAKDNPAAEAAGVAGALARRASDGARTGMARGGMARIEEHPEWELLARIPMKLSAAIPMPGFKVRDLVGLTVGRTFRSAWSSSDDVPLKIGSVLLSWSEFEVVEQTMAIRLTRLG